MCSWNTNRFYTAKRQWCRQAISEECLGVTIIYATHKQCDVDMRDTWRSNVGVRFGWRVQSIFLMETFWLDFGTCSCRWSSTSLGKAQSKLNRHRFCCQLDLRKSTSGASLLSWLLLFDLPHFIPLSGNPSVSVPTLSAVLSPSVSVCLCVCPFLCHSTLIHRAHFWCFGLVSLVSTEKQYDNPHLIKASMFICSAMSSI